MKFRTRHSGMIMFVVLNLVNRSQQALPYEDVWCQWGYSDNALTHTSTCDDGTYNYGFASNQCHHKQQGRPTTGIDCKQDGTPVEGVKCVLYFFKLVSKYRGYYDCAYPDAGGLLTHYQCGSLDNIHRCQGSPSSKNRD